MNIISLKKKKSNLLPHVCIISNLYSISVPSLVCYGLACMHMTKKTNVSLLKTHTAQMKGNTVIIRNDANLEES